MEKTNEDLSDTQEFKDDLSSSEESEVQALRYYIAKLNNDEQINDYESDEHSALRLKKSIFLPRIGTSKRSQHLFRKFGSQKRSYYMPRLGRNLNENSRDVNKNEYQQKRANKRAIHMLRIGK